MKKRNEKAFACRRPNGFHLTFPNGNWISTIWGPGSYSENHMAWFGGGISAFDKFMESNTCEVMIDCKPRLLKQIHKRFDGDGAVIGHLDITQWLEILSLLANDTNNTA